MGSFYVQNWNSDCLKSLKALFRLLCADEYFLKQKTICKILLITWQTLRSDKDRGSFAEDAASVAAAARLIPHVRPGVHTTPRALRRRDPVKVMAAHPLWQNISVNEEYGTNDGRFSNLSQEGRNKYFYMESLVF